MIVLLSRVASLSTLATFMASSQRPVVFGMGSMRPKVDPPVALESGASLSSPWSDPIDLATIVSRQSRY